MTYKNESLMGVFLQANYIWQTCAYGVKEKGSLDAVDKDNYAWGHLTIEVGQSETSCLTFKY